MAISYILCLCFCLTPSFSQDKIYLASEHKDGKVIEITPEKVKYKNPQNPGPVYTISRDKVLFLFSSAGNFCVMGNSDQEAKFSQSLLSQGASPSSDLIITGDGNRIICNIDKEDNGIIYYTARGNATKIEYASVIAIIYKNGQHKITHTDYAKVADVLKKSQPAAEVAAKQPAMPTNIIQPEKEPAKPVAPQQTQATVMPVSNNSESTQAATVVRNAAAAPVAAPAKNKTRDIIPEEIGIDFKEYEKKALQKTKELSDYLKVLCDKNTEYERADKAIDQACLLFINEEATVAVSSINRGTSAHYKIREYLKKLKLIKYGKVEIEWTNIQYVSRLRKGTDGNYYGVITFEQVFRGYMDNAVVYNDVTTKNIEVVLKAYNKSVEGRTTSSWDVLLSDIGVVETKKAS